MLVKTVGGREDTLMAKVAAITRKYYICGSWQRSEMESCIDAWKAGVNAGTSIVRYLTKTIGAFDDESGWGSSTRTAEDKCLGDRWAYLKVMVGDVCPKRLLTVARGNPRISARTRMYAGQASPFTGPVKGMSHASSHRCP